jgi:hypothetical protein
MGQNDEGRASFADHVVGPLFNRQGATFSAATVFIAQD